MYLESNEESEERLTQGDWIAIFAPCVFVVSATFIFSLMESWEQIHLNLVFFVIVVVVLVLLCLDDPRMWEIQDDNPTLMTHMSHIRDKYDTHILPIDKKSFIFAWFAWLIYSHLLGENDYSFMDHAVFFSIKCIPPALSWFLLFSDVLEMSPELLHYVLMFLVAAISIVPHTSVMAPQVSSSTNLIRTVAASMLYVLTNVLLFRRFHQNYKLRRNRQYISPLLVMWIFFVPYYALATIVLNGVALAVRDRTDNRLILGGQPDPDKVYQDYGHTDLSGFRTDLHNDQEDDPYEYDYPAAYDDIDSPVPVRRLQESQLKKYAVLNDSRLMALELPADELDEVRRYQEEHNIRSASPLQMHNQTPSRATAPKEEPPARKRRLMVDFAFP